MKTPAEEYMALYIRTLTTAEVHEGAMHNIYEAATVDERKAIDRAYALQVLAEHRAEQDYLYGD